MTVPALQCVDLHTHLGGHAVLRGVNLTVVPNRVHFILGQSGAGKSVILKQVVGLVPTASGELYCEGQPLHGLKEADFMAVRRRCQLVFQHAALLDHLTVLQNVALVVRQRGLSRDAVEAHALARLALQQVHAENLAHRMVPSLGIGLQKRVAIARALALRPKILLLDEPTTGLDPISARRCDDLMKRLGDATGPTQVVVSHDLISVREVADAVSFLHHGQITFTGSAAQFFASEQPEIRQFIGPER